MGLSTIRKYRARAGRWLSFPFQRLGQVSHEDWPGQNISPANRDERTNPILHIANPIPSPFVSSPNPSGSAAATAARAAIFSRHWLSSRSSYSPPFSPSLSPDPSHGGSHQEKHWPPWPRGDVKDPGLRSKGGAHEWRAAGRSGRAAGCHG
jgi:hypothetical protein